MSMSSGIQDSSYVRPTLLLVVLLVPLWAFVSCASHSPQPTTQAFAGTGNVAYRDWPRRLRQLQLISRDKWVGSDLRSLWRTDDGGRTWIEAYSPKPEVDVVEYIRGVSFPDSELGFLIDRAKLHRTNNGGATWTEIGPVQSGTEACAISECNYFHACYFVNSLHGWVVGLTRTRDFPVREPQWIGVVLATTDGGLSWQRQRNDLPRDHPNKKTRWSLNSVYFRDENVGWIAGDGVIFWTADGGQTWNLSDIQSRHSVGDIEHISFLDRQYGWATIRDRVEILTTSDGGRTWVTLRGPTRYPGVSQHLVFVTPERGFVVADSLYETTNGGKSWRQCSTEGCERGTYTHLAQALDGTLMTFCFQDGLRRTIIPTGSSTTCGSISK